MAADILLYNAEIIPVGRDQKQHIEITRDIADRFNSTYGEVFTLPEPRISETVAVIPGIDGQKMSKSYGNTINIFEEEKPLRKKIMKIVTDSTPVDDPKDPETCSVFALYRLFADPKDVENMKDRYLAGGMGYGEAKKELFELVWEFFRPYREKRAELASDPDAVRDILKMGAEKTRLVALETLEKVRKLTGIAW
jgi:tryptophanyl-tRNA synthetase